MTTKIKILTALAATHFALVVLGAAGVNFAGARDRVFQVLCWYGEVSGASSQHGFFAPGVPTPNRVAFEMIDAAGNRWADELSIGRSSEANLRLEAVTFDWPSMEEAALRADPMNRSFVATMFQRHPDAVMVRVHYQFQGLDETTDFPTMQEYRDGKRAEWRTARFLDYERAVDANHTDENQPLTTTPSATTPSAMEEQP